MAGRRTLDEGGRTVVRRTRGPHTDSVHALLRHLRSSGFHGCPEPLESHEADIVTYLEGAASTPPPESVWTDQALESIGRLLRAAHDASRSFRPPSDACWNTLVGASNDGEVVCHNDLYWGNVVFRDGRARALIDWEYAAPGDPLDDVGMAARYWVPLVSEERRRQISAPDADFGGRLRRFCDAYGLRRADRARLLDATERRLMVGYETQRAWAAEGRSPFAEAWENGSGELLIADRDWLVANRDLLAAGLA